MPAPIVKQNTLKTRYIAVCANINEFLFEQTMQVIGVNSGRVLDSTLWQSPLSDIISFQLPTRKKLLLFKIRKTKTYLIVYETIENQIDWIFCSFTFIKPQCSCIVEKMFFFVKLLFDIDDNQIGLP